MARPIVVALVWLLGGLLGVAPVGDGSDAVAQGGGEPTPPPLETALLPGATSFETLASDVTTTVADGPVLLRLERVTLWAGVALPPRTASGPELLLVEAGEVVVADAFGIQAPLAANAHVLLRPGVA